MRNVEELMSKKVVSLEPKHSVAQARRLLQEHRVSALPVLDEKGLPKGIVSAVDLAADIDSDTPVSELMSKDVYAISVGDSARKAAQVMGNRHIHHLLVVQGGEVAGILSAFDLLRVVDWDTP